MKPASATLAPGLAPSLAAPHGAGTAPAAARRGWIAAAARLAGAAAAGWAWPAHAQLREAAGPGRAADAAASAGPLPASDPASAIPAPQGLPAAQPPRPLGLPPMPMHRLGNGLSVVTVPRRGWPLVSLQLMLRVGDDADPPGRPGVAGVTALLLAKGARRQGKPVQATELARQAEALGGELTTGSGWRSLSASLTVTSDKLPAALALLADVVRHPLLEADELERARRQLQDSLRVGLGNPAQVAQMVLRRAAWGPVAYGAVTAPGDIERLTLAEVRRFHAVFARPELAALVVAGDADPDRIAVLAQQLLGDWPAHGALLPQPAADPARPIAAPLVLVDLPGSGQSAVGLALPFAGSQDEDRIAGRVAEAVLGGGYSARLNQAVRIRRGLSYGAFSSTESFRPGGMLWAQSQTAHATAGEVLDVMRAEVAAMLARPPSRPELEARRASLIGSHVRGLQTTGGLAALAAGQLASGRPLADLPRHIEALQQVTPEAVLAFARRHWTPERMRAVVVGDLAAAGAGLSATARPEAWRIPMAALDFAAPALRRTDPPAAQQAGWQAPPGAAPAPAGTQRR